MINLRCYNCAERAHFQNETEAKAWAEAHKHPNMPENIREDDS